MYHYRNTTAFHSFTAHAHNGQETSGHWCFEKTYTKFIPTNLKISRPASSTIHPIINRNKKAHGNSINGIHTLCNYYERWLRNVSAGSFCYALARYLDLIQWWSSRRLGVATLPSLASPYSSSSCPHGTIILLLLANPWWAPQKTLGGNRSTP